MHEQKRFSCLAACMDMAPDEDGVDTLPKFNIAPEN